MAQIKEIKYDVTCRLQQYESLKVGCTAMVTEGENPGKVMEEVKKFVHASADKAVKEYWDKLNRPVQSAAAINVKPNDTSNAQHPSTTTKTTPVSADAVQPSPGKAVINTAPAPNSDYEEPIF